MNIGQAAAATGVSAKMIRYYEETGLISPPSRSRAGYRVYDDTAVQTLRFVRRARDLGFTVRQIQDLLALWRDRGRASADVKRIARVHIAELEQKKRQLEEMIGAIATLAKHCHGDKRSDCPILSSLGGETMDKDGGRSAPARGKPAGPLRRHGP